MTTTVATASQVVIATTAAAASFDAKSQISFASALEIVSTETVDGAIDNDDEFLELEIGSDSENEDESEPTQTSMTQDTLDPSSSLFPEPMSRSSISSPPTSHTPLSRFTSLTSENSKSSLLYKPTDFTEELKHIQEQETAELDFMMKRKTNALKRLQPLERSNSTTLFTSLVRSTSLNGSSRESGISRPSSISAPFSGRDSTSPSMQSSASFTGRSTTTIELENSKSLSMSDSRSMRFAPCIKSTKGLDPFRNILSAIDSSDLNSAMPSALSSASTPKTTKASKVFVFRTASENSRSKSTIETSNSQPPKAMPSEKDLPRSKSVGENVNPNLSFSAFLSTMDSTNKSIAPKRTASNDSSLLDRLAKKPKIA